MDKIFIQAAFYSHPYATRVFLGRTNNSPGLYGTAGVHDVTRASWIGPASSSSFSPLYIGERERKNAGRRLDRRAGPGDG